MGIILRMDVPQSLMFSAYKRYIKSYNKYCKDIESTGEKLDEHIELTSEKIDEHIKELGEYFMNRECEKSKFLVSFLTFYGVHIENMYGDKPKHERKI